MLRLVDAVNEDSPTLSPEACEELEALATLLSRARWRRVPLTDRTRTITAISDAMWAPHSARFCDIIITEDGQSFGRWMDIPAEFQGLRPCADPSTFSDDFERIV